MLYDSLLKVGLIMRGPGIPPGRVVDDPVSNVDLAGTFGAWAGTQVGSAAHSRSLLPLLQDGETVHEHVYSEWRLGPARCGVPLDLRCVRTRHGKLTLESTSGVGELYDLENDPFECTDRFSDPAYRGLRDELTQRLMARPRDVIDPPRLPSGPG